MRTAVERVVPFYACEHGTPGGCRKCSKSFRSPNVVNVLNALDFIHNEIDNEFNEGERKELAGFLTQMADAFKAEAPEELKVPGIDEVTMKHADLSKALIDAYLLV